MGLRAKFVFLLVVYSAGFLTAIYCLAPAPEQTPGQATQRGSILGSLKSDEFATSVNSGIHKAIGLSKEAAERAAKRIREKIEQAQSKSDK
jgi:hypothetical protein